MATTGIVIDIEPDMTEEVISEITRKTDIEISGMVDERRVVAVIKAESPFEEETIISILRKTKGVAGISRAYHHIESREEGP